MEIKVSKLLCNSYLEKIKRNKPPARLAEQRHCGTPTKPG